MTIFSTLLLRANESDKFFFIGIADYDAKITFEEETDPIYGFYESGVSQSKGFAPTIGYSFVDFDSKIGEYSHVGINSNLVKLTFENQIVENKTVNLGTNLEVYHLTLRPEFVFTNLIEHSMVYLSILTYSLLATSGDMYFTKSDTNKACNNSNTESEIIANCQKVKISKTEFSIHLSPYMKIQFFKNFYFMFGSDYKFLVGPLESNDAFPISTKYLSIGYVFNL